MVDDTYYITPHEAALAVVATAMKKSRLPVHILFLNSIIAGFLFSSGSMLYIVCESTGYQMRENGFALFVSLSQGLVYSIGLFYVVICGMELFNSNILYFSTGVMRGAVTLMDLLISWFVSFWTNLASSIFVMYLFGHVSKVFQQPDYIKGTVAIGIDKNSYSFMETFLKGVIGNFYVCLAIYLQIMVKPIHVKFLMILLPIFTFVALGFTHVVADMGLVPAAIFNNCGYGFGHYFWKIMLPGALGNIVGGSFFGILIPWYLHLVVIEQDMKKLNLPAYEERDEQPGLNMDSRVVRVPVNLPSSDETSSSIAEFKPDDEHDISRMATHTSMSSGVSAYPGSLRRTKTVSSSIRSPKGVFPVVDMGPPLQHEKTIASAYQPDSNIDDVFDDDYNQDVGGHGGDNGSIPFDQTSISNSYNGGPLENPYDPSNDRMGDKLMRAITRSVTKTEPSVEGDLEKGTTTSSQQEKKSILKKWQTGPSNINDPKKVDDKYGKFNNNLFRQFTYGGGGNNKREIHRRLSNAKITRKAAARSDDIAGIHSSTVDHIAHTRSNRKSSVSTSSKHEVNDDDKQKMGAKYANDRWKHMVYDYELDGEMPVSYISNKSSELGPLSNVEEEPQIDLLKNENPQSSSESDTDNIVATPIEYEPSQ